VFLLHSALASANIDDIRRRAERMAAGGSPRGLSWRGEPRAVVLPPELAVTLRYARPDDEPELARLASLDERPVPTGPVLLAEVEGELRAALSLHDGATLANPFFPSAGLLHLLVARAAQLRGEQRTRAPRLALLRRVAPRSAASR
jgi:hypothetical protein